MTGPRIGSLCSGYDGLALGVQSVIGGDIAWQADNEPAAETILATRYPYIPNLGDITIVEWSAVDPVDWLLAGYPCQPFSHAGKRKGTTDERHLWPYIAAAIGVLRPRVVFLENVEGHVSLGLDTVLGDLAALGYDATWGVVRAADAGAPHGRARLFILATDTESIAGRVGHGNDVRAWWPTNGSRATTRRGVATDPALGGRWPTREQRRLGAAGHEPSTPADARGETVGLGAGLCKSRAERIGRGRPDDDRAPSPSRDAPDEHDQGSNAAGGGSRSTQGAAGGSGGAPTDPTRNRWDEGRTEPARVVGGSDAAERSRPLTSHADVDGRAGLRWQHFIECDPDRCGSQDIAWGRYEPAIRRWEQVTGRCAPRPTEAGRSGQRLSPYFVEWMQGLLAGWVTDVGLKRNEELKALGNGCVPQQVALALRTLLPLCELAA